MDKTRITNANKQHARRSAGAGDFWKGEQMEELIKRLERVIQTGAPNKDGMHPISAEVVLEVVKQLPPAQPRREERKIGEWIYDWGDWDFETCKCSECGNHTTTPIGERYSFCPKCGADMREVTT